MRSKARLVVFIQAMVNQSAWRGAIIHCRGITFSLRRLLSYSYRSDILNMEGMIYDYPIRKVLY